MAAPLEGRGADRLQVRIGIHTGLVVVGEMGGGTKREQLALGDTPNIAARLQGLAEPDTVLLSAATQRLVADLFEFQDLGTRKLKGVSTPLSVYRVVRESEVHNRFAAAVSKGLTPLRKGRVVAHSEGREDIHRTLKEHSGSLCIHFTGGLPRDTGILFPCPE
jgi:hypothetical protein